MHRAAASPSGTTATCCATIPNGREPAARVAALGRDVTEILLELGLRPSVREAEPDVTYHASCTMQHGLGLRSQSKALLTQAGFAVREPAEAHVCCGSAGAYSVLQPEIAEAAARPQARPYRGDAKPRSSPPATSAASASLPARTDVPVVHTVELLDWATGGPEPADLRLIGMLATVSSQKHLLGGIHQMRLHLTGPPTREFAVIVD